MSKMFQVYGIGQALIPVLPPPLPFENPPNSNQTNYEIGQLVYTPPGVATDFYIYAGAGNWIHVVDSDGPVQSVLGTANQITATNVAGVVTLSIPATFIAPGSIASTTTLTGGTGITATTGNIVASTGNITSTLGSVSAATTVTAGTGITATTGNIVASTGNITSTLGSMSAATTVTAGTGVTATTGDITASTGNLVSTLGSVSAATTVTGGTGVTATTGNITATAGNFVSSLAGNGLLFNANTATGAAASPVVLNSRAGQVVFTSVSIAAAADLTLTITNSAIIDATTQVIYSMSGSTTGSAPSIKSVTNSAGSSAIVVTNGTGATTTTADITLNFIVVN